MRPMLAIAGDVSLRDPRLVYEPKYDGIRALAEIEPAAGVGAPRVRLLSRAGNDKTSQFPEIVAALVTWMSAWASARTRGSGPGASSVVLDGEIVALDPSGAALGFQRLQDRIHLTVEDDVRRLASARPVAYVIFDVLHDGGQDLRGLPLAERRIRLEELLSGALPAALRASQIAVGDGTALYEQALENGWEGLIAKDGASRYRSGERSPDWRKIKLFKRQELVIGGWTESRSSRAQLGALLLGLPDGGGLLRYAGHVGSGFSEGDLRRLGVQLAAREVRACPFLAAPPANERPHWVRPELVAEVRFSGWTDAGIVRHAVFLGLRDDVPAVSIEKEEVPVATIKGAVSRGAGSKAKGKTPGKAPGKARAKRKARATTSTPSPAPTPLPAPASSRTLTPTQLAKVVAVLEEIEGSRNGGSGTVALPGGASVEVTHLGKELWPALGITKGELMRYYALVAPYILPVVADRPMVMRRFPDGTDGPAFYQQRGPAKVPAGVRVEPVAADKEVPTRLIGGSLATLLYMIQIASISQDPWFSRASSTDDMDFAAIDLDPSEGVPFSRVRDVARWVHDQLLALGVEGFPKTSGATGMHVYIPLRRKTPYESGLLFCQMVATLVARQHPAAATVERSVKGRPPGSVYIDYLQNIRGKTIACAYSARASAFAGASTPVTWDEIDQRIAPGDLTIRTLPARLRAVGDLWAGLRRSKGVDLQGALHRAQARHGSR